ncbi:MAG: tetratricopeptide repeat protein [Candidatus Midichloria mitochondrii]|uniref:tetratricopeptide repeat protein n=1 Tax=Candidatus Midichloria mitochondrii TaxID=234827 RepID=UPI0002D52439|nr:tetratricopeptide repeat protein [Candidatus Midichloria mitochondrii]MDJ1256597.1 tetratricopeptide repeat protein [Candidatus Midichloria mitochondrii]MDJ1288317.1 tetratricopeptide repeat protein [Candidatus Midichloria mitochondrii]MDJ1299173.1 tetratricopeptide repeat protein [Candidatus Midichloria mitochondrii]MDJ1313304.1 tetratricopeptide repeat protein [Candidatus Midichloria mitochondrii]MDJ1583877.1 tetratricopeptide repeat protein [Candidatus Midichloria mitochondrii]
MESGLIGIYKHFKRIPEAIEAFYKKDLTIYQKIYGAESREIADLHGDMSDLYKDFKLFEKTAEELHECITIYKNYI